MLRTLRQFEFISVIRAIIERPGCGSFANFSRSSSLSWSKFLSKISHRMYIFVRHYLVIFTGEPSTDGWDAAIVATAATNATAAAAATGNHNGVAAAVAATTATADAATTAAAVAATTAAAVAATTGTAWPAAASVATSSAAAVPEAAAKPAAWSTAASIAAESAAAAAAAKPAAATIPATAAWTGEILKKYCDDYLVRIRKTKWDDFSNFFLKFSLNLS